MRGYLVYVLHKFKRLGYEKVSLKLEVDEDFLYISAFNCELYWLLDRSCNIIIVLASVEGNLFNWVNMSAIDDDLHQSFTNFVKGPCSYDDSFLLFRLIDFWAFWELWLWHTILLFYWLIRACVMRYLQINWAFWVMIGF